MIKTIPEAMFTGDAAEGAALGLLTLMTGLSEEHYSAGWLIGLERSLWRIAHEADADADRRFGQGTITDRQVTLLRLLSEEAGGWWHWPKLASEPAFITLADWGRLLAPNKETSE